MPYSAANWKKPSENNVKHLPSILILLLFVCRTIPAGAFVYLPGISSGSSDRIMTASDLPGISSSPLVKEKVNVNGTPLTLEIYQVKSPLDVIQRTIKNRFKPEQLEAGNDYVRAIFRKDKDLTERWLFVFAGEKRPVTAFKMELPGKIAMPVKWPSELPVLPSDCRPNMVMELPRLNAVYGSFDSNTGSGVQQLASYSARLASAGWYHAGAEHAPSIRGTGEIYFRNNPARQIMWIKFGEDGSGAFYLKKLKK